MSENNDKKCEDCNIDWGCINCNKEENTFSVEYLELLSELFGDN